MTDAERRSGTSFKVLRRRNFAVFWSAALVSNTGSWMQTIAVPYVIYQMTHSTTWLGFAAFMNFIPATLVGPVAGSLADRHSRRKLLVLTQTAMMISAFALWAVWVKGAATPGIIVGIVFLSGFVAGTNITTWQAFVPQLVERHEIVDAVRLNSMQFTGARTFGPALAGIVLQAFGASAAFLANAVSFVLVLGALLLIHPRPQVYSHEPGRVLQRFREGWRFVRVRRALLLPIVMIGMASLFGTSVIQLAPALAKDVFHVGRGAYGMLVASFGFGAVTGAVVVAIVADRMHRSLVARLGSVGLAFGIVALGLAPAYIVGVGAFFLMGLMYVLLSVSLNTGLQARVDDTFRGRAISMYLSSLLLGVPIGALIQGKLASMFHLRAVIVGSGVLFLVSVAYAMARFDRLRPLDEGLVSVEPDPFLSSQPAIAGAD